MPSAAHWALIPAQDSSQRLGLGSLYAWPLRAALPMLPLTPTTTGGHWFPIRLGVRRWRRGRCANQLESWGEENEGTPFRCLGLHTHRKAPAEAQTRFSEDILQPNSTGWRSMQHSQTLQAGQSMTRRTHSIYQVADPPSTKPGQSFAVWRLPDEAPSTTQSGCAGLRNRRARGRHQRRRRQRTRIACRNCKQSLH